MRLFKFVIFSIFLAAVESANILAIFSLPFYSHQMFNHKVLEILAEEGHNITVFTSHPYAYGDSLNVTQHHFAESNKIQVQYVDQMRNKKTNINYVKLTLLHELRADYKSVSAEMEHPEIQNLIKNSSNYNFDLVIMECVICPSFLFAEIYDCPVAIISASELNNIGHAMFGNDVNPFKYSETLILPYPPGKLTILEKVDSLIYKAYQELVLNFFYFLLHGIINLKYFHHLGMTAFEPPLNRVSLLMINTNHAIGHVRPMMPHSIQIGFVHVEKPKAIEDLEIKEFLDRSKNGVIVKAFGSRSDGNNFGKDVMNKFINAFKMTNMSVLWKLDKIDESYEIPYNVKVVSSLPIADVLAHPNVKIMIFHGGLMSTYEAVDREVPMIVFPLTYDHPANARMLVDKGIAIQMDLNNFDEFQLSAAIKEVTDPKYKINVRKVRTIAYDQPISTRDLIVWHVNNAIRNRLTYAKDFGRMSSFGAPLNLLLIYFTVLGCLIYFLVRKLTLRLKQKVD